jgi:hypothetical protein
VLTAEAGIIETPPADTAPLVGAAVAEDEAAEAPEESVADADAPAEPVAVTDAGGTDETPLTLIAPPPPAAAVEEAPDESVDEDPDESVDEDPDVSVDDDPEFEESVEVVVDEELPLLPPLLPDEPPLLFTPPIVKVHVLTS